MLFYLPGGLLKRGDADLADLTASVRTGEARWLREDELPVEVDGVSRAVDVLLLPLDPPPSALEVQRIRRRLVTSDRAEEDLLNDLVAALDDPALSPGQRALTRAQLAAYGEPTQ